MTTREPRPGEVDGREYFFITQERFDEMVEAGELLEHAGYVNHSYGTPRAYVEKQLEKGFHVILDIEIQGARQVHEKELRRRLEGRGTDSKETIDARIDRARQEIHEADFYNYLIINEDADQAADQFRAIMTAEQCRFCREDLIQFAD